MQRGTDMIGLAENAAALRRKRALLNRAYRAAKRSAQHLYKRRHPEAADAFLNAAKIAEGAETMGLNVGTIQHSDQLNAAASRQLAHEGMGATKIANYFERKKEPAPQQQVADSFTQAGHTPYPDEFLYNLGLLQRHAPEY